MQFSTFPIETYFLIIISITLLIHHAIVLYLLIFIQIRNVSFQNKWRKLLPVLVITDSALELISHCFFLFHLFQCCSFEEKCPIECGRHGLCSKGICNCSAGWKSRNCSLPTCPVVCNNGSCDAKTRKCNCASGYSGLWKFWSYALLSSLTGI